ncbi:MAG: hypothetical protein AB1505_28710 [Candidatus Latescibacterota bacterium]
MRKRAGFFGARSGIAGPRRVLELGPVVLALTLIAVLGTATTASAVDREGTDSTAYFCIYVGPGQETWCCTPDVCNVQHGWTWRDHVYRDLSGTCWYLESVCNCF